MGRDKNRLPFWALTYSTYFDESAIRNDYATLLNDMYLQTVSDKSSPMAWAKDHELHLINLSSIKMIEPHVEIDRWKNEIELAQRYESKDWLDQCFYGSVARFFDSLHIHSMESDILGVKWTDDVTVIYTDREIISSLKSHDEVVDFLDKRNSAVK